MNEWSNDGSVFCVVTADLINDPADAFEHVQHKDNEKINWMGVVVHDGNVWFHAVNGRAF